MIDEELIQIWKSSEEREQIKFKKSKMLIELRFNLNQFEKSIKYRDLREIFIAAIMIPVFGVLAYDVPFFVSKIGALIIMFWCFFVIVKLVKTKKHKPIAPTESFIDYLQNTKAYLTAQKRVLDNALYWYILPCFTGIIIFFIGFNKNFEKLLIIVFPVIGLAVIIYYLNKHAVKKEFIPRLERIDELIKNAKE